MRTGVLDNGFCFEIDEKKLDDMEFLDVLSEVSENSLALSKVCKMMLGDEQRKRLYDHVRTEDGRVPIEAVTDSIVEIMLKAGDETKNS